MAYKDINKQREFQSKWVANRRAEHIALRGGCCIKCGSKENLEFHHRDRSLKKDHKVWSWKPERTEAELNKCDLLCSECHKVETSKERGYGTAAHGTLTSYKKYQCRCIDCRNANAEYEHKRRLQAMSV